MGEGADAAAELDREFYIIQDRLDRRESLNTVA
jgi:hypothetical protein